ncbi:FAD-binding oxidoreductase [Leptolyngbya sp. FACHB-261]|uniref:NAD(P)/FAD-dependent oxidoreductase n=1 Tax=Leptolyngbya sp. FACHB-261 TaxID=2692806 RepID=UPI00168A01E4|nr:FAD-dependent oxidoreductase [Leptolyngbya sp. FACHB-261]MBD2100642.1 FAD-binding oxidoreductase [Leptolyngbya sp. FACHB-261]
MTHTADAVVIGGGITGISVALHLAKAGLSVTLLEKGHLGGGPTGRSLAVISQHYTDPTLVKLARTSLEIFSHFSEHYKGSAGFVKTGLVVLVPPAQTQSLHQTVEMQQGLGVQVSVFNATGLASLDARLCTDDVGLASYQPGAGYADPVQTMATLTARAREAGVDLREQTSAVGLKTGSSTHTVETSGLDGELEISTPVVIDCAGPWAAQVAQWVGLTLPLVSCRQVMAVLQRPSDFGVPHLSVNDFVHGTSFRTQGSDTFVGWFDRGQTQDPIDPDQFDDSVPGERLAPLQQKWQKRYPSSQPAILRGGWSGLYDVTPDWMPIIDQIGPEGFYVCCGHSGHGFKFGPYLGQLMTQWITQAPPTELKPLGLSRFA